jgi:hypothetical protein
MRLAFQLYDVDGDNRLSERDLYWPFLNYSEELYADAFVEDLPRILKQLTLKLSLNKPRERPLPPKPESTGTIGTTGTIGAEAETVTVTLNDFSLAFEPGFPALIDDVLLYVALVPLAQRRPLLDHTRPLPNDDTGSDGIDPWKEKEFRYKIVAMLHDKPLADSVISVFKALAANPNAADSKAYITLDSLTRHFVILSCLTHSSLPSLATPTSISYTSSSVSSSKTTLTLLIKGRSD